MKPYQLRTVGDRAVSIEFPNEINPEINLRLQALAKIITADKITGIRPLSPPIIRCWLLLARWSQPQIHLNHG